MIPGRQFFRNFCSGTGVRIAAAGLLLALTCPHAASGVTLATRGETDYVIVIADDAIPAEQTAATELKKYLEQVTGAEFVVADSRDAHAGRPRIHVGPSALAQQLAPEIASADLGSDGIVIKTLGRDLILAGGRPRGTLYAVYTFLQDEIGCRWYADDMAAVVPARPTLTIRAQDVVYRPPFDLRWLYTYIQRSGEARDTLFSAKFRQNGGDRHAQYGGGLGYGGAHTMTTWILPPEEFFAENPDWYAISSAGERNSKVPCYSSAGARRKAAERVLERVRRDYPDWEYAPQKVISVSHPDVGSHCLCPDCEAALEKYRSDAGAMLEFVNYVAEQVEKEFPDVLISTLAYWNTAAPPQGIEARRNVLIHLGISNYYRNDAFSEWTPRDFRRPFQDTAGAQGLVEWNRLARHLHIWDYDTNFRNMIQPHPTYFAFPESLRFYRDQGASGVFSQGGWSNAGDFIRMKYWVNSQMMWDPDQDAQALMKEFLAAYYGAAAPHLMAYLELMNGIERRLGPFIDCTRSWLGLEDLNRATELFELAEAAVAEDETLSFRVRRNRLSIDIVWLQRYRELWRTAQEQGLDFPGPDDPYAEVERIARNEFNAGTYREWGTFDQHIVLLRGLFPPRQGNPPDECTGLQPHQWLEIQEEMLQTVDAPTESVAVTDDPHASNGRALRLVISSPEVQAWYEIPASVSGGGTTAPTNLDGRWRVYIVMRSEAAKGRPTIIAGLRNNEGELHRQLFEAESPNEIEYRTVDLGAHKISAGTEVFVCTHDTNTADQGQTIYIDSFFLVTAE